MEGGESSSPTRPSPQDILFNNKSQKHKAAADTQDKTPVTGFQD
jgi:hypothetical protein